jgi:nitrogen regulatory protein P-II 2
MDRTYARCASARDAQASPLAVRPGAAMAGGREAQNVRHCGRKVQRHAIPWNLSEGGRRRAIHIRGAVEYSAAKAARCLRPGAEDSPKETPKESPMKLVIAIIKPFKLEDVRDALLAVGVHGMTVTEVKGYGRQKGHTEIYRGSEYAVNFLPKIRVEVAVAANEVERVVEAIGSAAKTGQIGDGKVFVTSIDQAIRIRTGETDADAL